MSIGENKVKSSYTLSAFTNTRIEQLAYLWGMSKTRVIESLVKISPRIHPEKKVAVLSLDPIICTTDGWEWEETYTGALYVEFNTQEPLQQMIISVKNLTFDGFTQWLSEKYPRIKENLLTEIL